MQNQFDTDEIETRRMPSAKLLPLVTSQLCDLPPTNAASLYIRKTMSGQTEWQMNSQKEAERFLTHGCWLNWEKIGFLGSNYTALQGIANIAASDPSKMKPSWTGLKFLVQDDAKSTQERVHIIFTLVKGVKIREAGAKESFHSTVIVSQLSIKFFATVN